MHDQTVQYRLYFFRIFYVVLTGGLFVSYLAVPVYDGDFLLLPAWAGSASFIAAFLGIWLGKTWKDKGFILLGIYISVIIVRVAVQDAELLFNDLVSRSLLVGIWVVGGCYSLARILTIQQLKCFLRVFVAIWTIGITAHCLIAIYAAWTDQIILTLGGSGWDIIFWFGRLRTGYYYPGTTGAVMSISGIITVYTMLVEPRMIVKVLYALASLIIVITLCLTDARTSMFSFCAGIGVLTFVGVSHLNRKKDKWIKSKSKKRQANSWIIATVCMLVVMFFSLILVLHIGSIFYEVKNKGNIIIPAARAESIENDNLQNHNRGLSGEDVLDGRKEIWESVLKYSLSNANIFFFGESIYNPMTGLNKLNGSDKGHCHNMPLQIMLESGIVGLIPVLLFGLYTARNAWRIIISRTIPLWLRLLPAIAVSVVVGDLGECFGWFAEWKIPTLAFLFIICGIINSVGYREGKRSKSDNKLAVFDHSI